MKLKPLQLACTALVLSLFITGSVQAASTKIRAQNFAGTYLITSPSNPSGENRILVISNPGVKYDDGTDVIVPPVAQLFSYLLKDPNNNDQEIGNFNAGYYLGSGKFTFIENDPATRRHFAIKINSKTGKGKGSAVFVHDRSCTDLSNEPGFNMGDYICTTPERSTFTYSDDYTIEKISDEIL
jgi:hypothetical protein